MGFVWDVVKDATKTLIKVPFLGAFDQPAIADDEDKPRKHALDTQAPSPESSGEMVTSPTLNTLDLRNGNADT